MDEIDTERRDTSWVEGELSTRFESLARGGVVRLPLAKRYYLTTPEQFSEIVEETVLDHRSFRYGRFECQNFVVGFRSVVSQRYNINSVGVVIDFDRGEQYNIVLYEDGCIEVVDPNKEPLVMTGPTDDHDLFDMKTGLIIL